MFTWPALAGIRSIPRANAQVSGLYLREFLQSIQSFQAKDPESFEKRNATLMLHSMGAEVLKSCMIHYPPDIKDKLFDTVILVAPEVDLRGHADWLEKINFASRIVVFLNSDDGMLNMVKIHTKEARLGMQLNHLNGEPERLAKNVNYIIADDVVTWHKYYLYDHTKEFKDILTALIEDDEKVFSAPTLETVDSVVYRITKDY
jgi:esterase/lipase superfamily enzyme